MLGQHRQVGPQHGDVEAGGADVHADQHAEPRVELEILGPPAAGGALQAGFGQEALLHQPGDQRIGLALGEAQPFGHAMARAAGRPEGRFQQLHLVGSEAAPGAQASSPEFVLVALWTRAKANTRRWASAEQD
jgi:hypothetical protein